MKLLIFLREVKNSQRQVKWKLSRVEQFHVCRSKILNLSQRFRDLEVGYSEWYNNNTKVKSFITAKMILNTAVLGWN